MSESVNTKTTVISEELSRMIKENPIMDLAVKALNTSAEKSKYTVQIPVSLEDVKKNNTKASLSEIMNKSIFIVFIDDNGNTTGYPIAKAVEYKEGVVSITFNKDIVPYILNL